MLKKLLSACTLLGLLAISLAACEQALPGSPNPQPSPTASTPAPLSDIPLPVTMPSLTLGTHPNVVFFTNGNTSRTSFNGLLERYDTVTQKSADVISMPGVKIEEAQLSSDGQWILSIAYITDHDELRLVRIDGQHLQTLLAAPPYAGLNSAQWSPNQQFIVFDQQPPESGPTITYLLDIQRTQLHPLLASGNGQNTPAYAPRESFTTTTGGSWSQLAGAL